MIVRGGSNNWLIVMNVGSRFLDEEKDIEL